MNKRTYYITILFIIVGLVVFMFSMSAIWIIDDFTYQYNFSTNGRITSVWEIFQSQNVHYLTRNGRYVAHWLCQLFLSLLGRHLFSITNALFYIALICAVIKLGKGNLLNFRTALTATIFVLFLCDTIYTPAFQIGYIWMSVVILSFIYLFFKANKNSDMSWWECAILFAFAVVSGNAHESINVGVGGTLAIYMLSNFKCATKKQWVLALGFFIGTLFLCLSPGSINRSDELDIPAIYSFATFVISLRMTYVFIIIFLYKLSRKDICIKNFYIANSFYVNAFAILLIFNLVLGVFTNRQLFGVELISAILSIKILKDHAMSTLPLVVGTAAMLALYLFKYNEIDKSTKTYAYIAKTIQQADNDTIYINIPQFSKYFNPAQTIRFGSYLDAVLENVLKEQSGKIETPDRIIKAYPEAFRQIKDNVGMNRGLEYNPGEFMLIQDKKNPQKFILHRKLSILGIGIPLPDYEVPFDHNSYLNTDRYNVLFIPITFSFIKNTGIETRE